MENGVCEGSSRHVTILNSQTGINYLDLLSCFQDHSDRGVTHKLYEPTACVLFAFLSDVTVLKANILHIELDQWLRSEEAVQIQ